MWKRVLVQTTGQSPRGDRVFQSDGIVLRIEGEKDFYVFVQAGTRFPDVPLIGGSVEGGGEILRNGVGAVIDDQLGG